MTRRRVARWTFLAVITAGAVGVVLAAPRGQAAATASTLQGIHKIQHVVVIMQENRSFDNYFGTYPGADGIPMKNGKPTVCVPDPESGECVAPFPDNGDHNTSGPHGESNAVADIDGGKMDGFIGQAQHKFDDAAATDVMSYHTGASLKNYWEYAHRYVLQDHLFASSESWSLSEHLYMVSGWSASCGGPDGDDEDDPSSCVSDESGDNQPPDRHADPSNVVHQCAGATESRACRTALASTHIRPRLRPAVYHLMRDNCDLSGSFVAWSDTYTDGTYMQCTSAINASSLPDRVKTTLLGQASYLKPPDYAWTDLTYLLHKQNVSWRYYVMNGHEPDCRDDTEATCPAHRQNARTPGIWNPLPYFDDVHEDHQLRDVAPLKRFYRAARLGTLPAVSWVTPNSTVSEHAPHSVSAGQAYVTGLVNSIERGPDWPSTAIFISWDEWGGFYDHVVPPTVDGGGYGLRVPGLLISPYARRGYIDNQVLSHDA